MLVMVRNRIKTDMDMKANMLAPESLQTVCFTSCVPHAILSVQSDS